MKKLNGESKAKEHKGVELNDEDMAEVSGGFTSVPEAPTAGSLCPNNHTKCTKANCMNPQCTHLVINVRVGHNECSCGKFVPGIFHIWR